MNATLKIYLTLPVSILLIGLINFFFPREINSKGNIERFWLQKTFRTQNLQIAIGGDSRIYRGVSPAIVDDKILAFQGAYNLAFSGAGFSDQYLDFIESKLVKNLDSTIIILGVSPHSLSYLASKNEDLNSYLNQSWFDRTPILSFFGVFKFLMPYKVSDILFSLLGIKKKDDYFEDFQNNGWVKSDRKNVSHDLVLDKYRKELLESPPNEKLIDNLFQRVKKWSDSGAVVVGFRPPSSLEMEMLEDSLSGVNMGIIKDRFIEATGFWIDFSVEDYESYDGSHLNFSSAEKLSKRLGEEINKFVKFNEIER